MKPLFIVGVPRSGTTLMRSLLQVFNEVYLPPDEFQLLPAIVSSDLTAKKLEHIIQNSNFADHMRRRGLFPSDDFVSGIAQLNDGPKAFQLLVQEIGRLDDAKKMTYWGDKTPENLFQLDDIFATWPDAKIIHVMRDPRSTVLSMKKSWGRSVKRGSVIWRDGIATLDRHKAGPYKDQIHDVQYEKLTQDPDLQLTKLADWLGLHFDPAALGGFQTEERWSDGKQTGIQPRGVAWQSESFRDDSALIEGICFDSMQSTPYLLEYANKRVIPSQFELKLAKIGDAWRVLQSYANERGWPAAIHYKARQWRASASK